MDTLNLSYNGESIDDTKDSLKNEEANINLEVSQGKNNSKMKKNIPMTPSMFDPKETQTEFLDVSTGEHDVTLEANSSMESQTIEETTFSLETKQETETEEETEVNDFNESTDHTDSFNLINETGSVPTEVMEENLASKVHEKEQKSVKPERKKKKKENSENDQKKVRGGKSNFPKSAQMNNLNNITEENHAEFYVYSTNEKSENESGNTKNNDVMANRLDNESQDKEEVPQEELLNEHKKAIEQKEQATTKRKPRKRFTRGTQVQSPYFKASKTEKRKTKGGDKADQLENTKVQEKEITHISKATENIAIIDKITEQNIGEDLDHELESIPGPSSANTSIDTKSEHSFLNNSCSSIENSPPTYRINIERDTESPNERSIYIALPPVTNSKITNINVKMTNKKYPKEKKVSFLQEESIIDLTGDDCKIKQEKISEERVNTKKMMKLGKENHPSKNKHSHGGKYIEKESRRKPTLRKKHHHHEFPSESSDTDFSSGDCSCSDCNEDYGSCSNSCSCSSSSEEPSGMYYRIKSRHRHATRFSY